MLKCLGGLLAAALVCAGCATQAEPAPHRSYAVPTPAPSTVASSIPKYDRDAQFGPGWNIVPNHFGCDTREVKIEEQTGADAVDLDGDKCKDDANFIDPYCGLIIIPHCPGRLVSNKTVQVDHVLSEHTAWVKGAWRWTYDQRRAFSQDRANLIVTFGPQNQFKGDKNPDQWRPPNPNEWCQYAQIYRLTARKYLLPLSESEDKSLSDMEATCHSTG